MRHYFCIIFLTLSYMSFPSFAQEALPQAAYLNGNILGKEPVRPYAKILVCDDLAGNAASVIEKFANALFPSQNFSVDEFSPPKKANSDDTIVYVGPFSTVRRRNCARNFDIQDLVPPTGSPNNSFYAKAEYARAGDKKVRSQVVALCRRMDDGCKIALLPLLFGVDAAICTKKGIC